MELKPLTKPLPSDPATLKGLIDERSTYREEQRRINEASATEIQRMDLELKHLHQQVKYVFQIEKAVSEKGA